jgi:hypothetical protein
LIESKSIRILFTYNLCDSIFILKLIKNKKRKLWG